jgi:DNA repair exonuclease SbcCD nuclease subunit
MFRHRFKIVDKITVDKIEGVTVICSAYPASEKELAEQLDSLILKHRQTPTVILGHWTVKGCQLNSGLSLSGLGKELLDRVDLALLGDVHKPQKIGKNGYYVGSPFQQDYGEAGEAKRVAILTLDNGAISLEFVPMVGFPEYRVVGYQQFVDMVTESSEDRYQVIIKSPEEAEKYYAHPLSGRAQPIYNYALTAAGSTEAQQATTDWSLKPSIVYWTKHHPPLESGVSATEDELAAFGESIAADGV